MRARKLLVASNLTIFALFFLHSFLGIEGVDVAGRTALGVFEFGGAAASLYLLSNAEINKASVLDWIVCVSAILAAGVGLAGYSITSFAFYLLIRDRHDVNARAAGTVAGAVVVQAIWAPLIFSKLSFLFLQIDAGVVGWLVRQFVPGATWDGTVVFTPSGHDVAIGAPCASFHNLSLASLCWVTLTMLHRPYWMKGDIYVGLVAALIQFGLNIWRLVLVCMSLPMYEFWHEGFGKHIFSAVATASAIIFVQVFLVRQDNPQKLAAIVR